jgi:site-specific DNA recombinase
MAPSAAAHRSRADTSTDSSRTPIYTGRIAHKGQLYPGQHPALIDDETWTAVQDQLAFNAGDHRRRALAAKPSLLAGLLVDAQGERLTPSHAVKKGRRYRYYVSAALITAAAKDDTLSWRLAAQEIEDCVIRILVDALTSPAKLLERLGTPGMPSEHVRKMLGRAGRLAAALRGSPTERAKIVRALVEQVIIDEKKIIVKVRRGALLGGDIPSGAKPQHSRADGRHRLQAARCRNQAGAARDGTTKPRFDM